MTALPRTANCLDCGKGITANTAKRSGRCITCGNKRRWADPAFQAARLAGIARKWANPEYAERMRKQAQRLGQKSALDEGLQERRRAYGKWVYANVLSRPDVRAKNLAAVKEKSGPSLRARRMAWCPQEMWDRYRYLMRTKKMFAVEARAVILNEWAELEAERSPDLPSAVDWLRRLAPIKQLDNGMYQHGSAILSPGEVMARAKFRGFVPFNHVKEPLKSANNNSEQTVNKQEAA